MMFVLGVFLIRERKPSNSTISLFAGVFLKMKEESKKASLKLNIQ